MKPIRNFDLQNQEEPSFLVVGGVESTLPVLATAGDVREAVQFLKRYTDGITISQAMEASRKKFFDPRKIAAYEFWGIISRIGDRLTLASLGWELAVRLAPEVEVYRNVLSGIAAYHSALEWVHERGVDLVTYFEIAEFWRREHPGVLEGHSEGEAEASVASFFHLCHAAEVGTLTIGRKGQPTRIHINRKELKSYFDNGFQLDSGSLDFESFGRCKPPRRIASEGTSARHLCVFISLRHQGVSLSRIKEALELAELGYVIIKRRQDQEACGLEESIEAMRRCDAGVIVITREDYLEGAGGQIHEQFLMGLGAALVHFGVRLVLLLQKGVYLPACLSGVSYCEFEEDVNWDVAVQLVRSLKQFRAPDE